MSLNTNDLVALVRLLIQNDTTVRTALGNVTISQFIGGRVVPPSYIDADAATLERPVVVVSVESGSGEGRAVQRLNVDLYAYCDDAPGTSRALYDALFDLLENARLYDPDGVITLKGYMREIRRPDTGHNPAMKSYYSRGTWQSHTA